MSVFDTPTSELSLVQETAIENGDPCYTLEQLDRFAPKLLRRLAANANTNEINGKSTMYEIKEYFACQRGLSEYE